MISHLKECPQLYIDMMVRQSEQTGERHIVIYDSLLEIYRVMSSRAFVGCLMHGNTRFETRASYIGVR